MRLTSLKPMPSVHLVPQALGVLYALVCLENFKTMVGSVHWKTNFRSCFIWLLQEMLGWQIFWKQLGKQGIDSLIFRNISFMENWRCCKLLLHCTELVKIRANYSDKPSWRLARIDNFTAKSFNSFLSPYVSTSFLAKELLGHLVTPKSSSWSKGGL